MIRVSDRISQAGLARPFAVAALGFALVLPAPGQADEADAKRILKAMSDFMGAQESMSFDYDSVLEVVTAEGQVLGLASSGSIAMERPGKVRASRDTGFSNIEIIYDGATFTLLGVDANKYVQVPFEGTTDEFIDALRQKTGRPMPAGDLLFTDVYEELMDGVTDIKDLGSGIIGGVECDTFAFRGEEVDWQIWIAHGDQPYPCRYAISSPDIKGSPQFSIQLSDFKAGDAATVSFEFDNSSDAEQITVEQLKDAIKDMPGNFIMEAKQ